MKHNITYYILLAALVLTACSNDDDLTGQPISDNSSIISFGLNSGGWQNGRLGTRAASQSDVEGLPDIEHPSSIGVWGYYVTPGQFNDNGTDISSVGQPIPNDYRVADRREGNSTNATSYKYLSNYRLTEKSASHQIHYSEGTDDINNVDGSFPWEAQQYMFYCYAPHVDDITGMTNSNVAFGPTNENYTKFTLSNVPSISNTDILIAQQRREWNRLGNPACVDFTSEGYQLLHLYAAVQFCFALHEDYAKIRYLHIKEVQITSEYELGKEVTYTVTKDVTAADGTITWSPTVQTSSAPTLTLTPRNNNEKFILGTSYAPFDTNIEAGHDYTDKPMTDATNKYFSYGWLYIAARDNKEIKADGSYDSSKLKKFRLTVTYDVYDRKGTCTRQNVRVSNDLKFPSSVTQFQAGYYYNAYIKINPDFLYVLSDKDNTADVVLKAGS